MSGKSVLVSLMPAKKKTLAMMKAEKAINALVSIRDAGHSHKHPVGNLTLQTVPNLCQLPT